MFKLKLKHIAPLYNLEIGGINYTLYAKFYPFSLYRINLAFISIISLKKKGLFVANVVEKTIGDFKI